MSHQATAPMTDFYQRYMPTGVDDHQTLNNPHPNPDAPPFPDSPYVDASRNPDLSHLAAPPTGPGFLHVSPGLSNRRVGPLSAQSVDVLQQGQPNSENAQSQYGPTGHGGDDDLESGSDDDDDASVDGHERGGAQTMDNGNTDAPPGLSYIEPPQQLAYTSLDETIEVMHAWNREHGFDVSKQKPSKNRNGELYKYLFRCTRHGKLDNHRKLTDLTRKRKRQSGKIGCPMGIYLKAVNPLDPKGRWQILHQRNDRSKWHNHGPADPETLSGHRRRGRTDELNAIIQQQRANGMDANETLAFLKEQMPEALVTRQDILNYRRNDPGVLNNHTNYRDKAYILCLAANGEMDPSDVFGLDMMTNLRGKTPVSVCNNMDQFVRHIERNPPKVIVVTDSALAQPEHRLQLARLVNYNQDGGTVVFAAGFCRTPIVLQNQMFLHHYNLPWETIEGTAHAQSNVKLNHHIAAGTGTCAVFAKNFAQGTDAKSIEALLALCPEAKLLSYRMFTVRPHVSVELVFSSQEGAEAIIQNFDGKEINLGRIATAPGRKLQFKMRPPASIDIRSLAHVAPVKTNYLTNVDLDHVLYEYFPGPNMYGVWDQTVIQQMANSPAAAAYVQVGRGWMGYVGLAEYDQNYQHLVTAMCHL
jgi:hypothetical protein